MASNPSSRKQTLLSLNQQKDTQKDTVAVGENYSANRTAAKKALHGYFYQVELLTLILIRMFESGKQFKLATEIADADILDDLVLEYWHHGNSTTAARVRNLIFLQAKHSKDENKMLTGKKVHKNHDPVKDPFGLPYYFLAYLRIKHRFKLDSETRVRLLLFTNHPVTQTRRTRAAQPYIEDEQDGFDSKLFKTNITRKSESTWLKISNMLDKNELKKAQRAMEMEIEKCKLGCEDIRESNKRATAVANIFAEEVIKQYYKAKEQPQSEKVRKRESKGRFEVKFQLKSGYPSATYVKRQEFQWLACHLFVKTNEELKFDKTFLDLEDCQLFEQSEDRLIISNALKKHRGTGEKSYTASELLRQYDYVFQLLKMDGEIDDIGPCERLPCDSKDIDLFFRVFEFGIRQETHLKKEIVELVQTLVGKGRLSDDEADGRVVRLLGKVMNWLSGIEDGQSKYITHHDSDKKRYYDPAIKNNDDNDVVQMWKGVVYNQLELITKLEQIKPEVKSETDLVEFEEKENEQPEDVQQEKEDQENDEGEDELEQVEANMEPPPTPSITPYYTRVTERNHPRSGPNLSEPDSD